MILCITCGKIMKLSGINQRISAHLIQRENILSISRGKVKVALKEFPKEVITAEEIIRRRIFTIVRIGLATIFFWLSALISMGATALAQTVTKDQPAKSKSSQRHRHHYKSFKHSTDPNESMTGTASWYGHGFHNRKTASGKRFDQNAMMAAHRTLPFGTMVKVTNMRNNKSCIVEITDRGPFVKNRIIDVSRGAAQELGFAGLAQVSLEVIEPVNLSYSPNHSRQIYSVADASKMRALAIR
jgi:rare lipoprotein A (peptidoglycan hydrolase)